VTRLFSTAIASVIVLGAFVLPAIAQEPQGSLPDEVFATARVEQILSERQDNAYGFDRVVQTVKFRFTNGPEEGEEFQTENVILNDRADMRLRAGETVIIDTQTNANGEVTRLIRDKYRLPNLLWLVAFFIVLTLIFGGLTGITSIAGLAVSVAILMLYVIPRIVAGSDPLTTSLVGSVAIACTSLYLAHGFNRRTSVALLSTIVTLGLSALMAVAFVYAAKLFGFGSEESLFLQTGLLENVNLRGLLLGGMIIGCLGVLDDVTTAQTAAIAEIAKASPALPFRDLLKAGKSVGKEHIASLINTLALAYVGASLPLFLLLTTMNDYPLWVTLNSEFLAEEIVRTLVGSATLLVAVPISTWFAAKAFQGGRFQSEGRGHGHSHR